jgi:ribosomal protein L7/L12
MDSFIPVDKVESYVESAKKLEDLPLMELIKNMEDKYGVETHMVIECMPIAGRESDDPVATKLATEEDVVWYVEFRDEKYMFEDFWEMRFHMLNSFE